MNEKLGAFLSSRIDVQVKGSWAAQAMRLRGAGGSPSLHLPIFSLFCISEELGRHTVSVQRHELSRLGPLVMRKGDAGCEEEQCYPQPSCRRRKNSPEVKTQSWTGLGQSARALWQCSSSLLWGQHARRRPAAPSDEEAKIWGRNTVLRIVP